MQVFLIVRIKCVFCIVLYPLLYEYASFFLSYSKAKNLLLLYYIINILYIYLYYIYIVLLYYVIIYILCNTLVETVIRTSRFFGGSIVL